MNPTEGQPKKYLSWPHIEGLIDQLTEQIVYRRITFDTIMYIPRGGAVIATYLAYRFDIEAARFFSPHVLMYHDLLKISKGILLVDEISDSGKTLKGMKDLINRKTSGKVPLWTATLSTRKTTSEIPNFSVLSIEDEWLVFPWE